jgi:hypothetical protein
VTNIKSVTIERVENGYIVVTESDDRCFVFQEWDAACRFMNRVMETDAESHSRLALLLGSESVCEAFERNRAAHEGR